MKTYWDTLLEEVLQKKDIKKNNKQLEESNQACYNAKKTTNRKPHVRIYPLGEKYKNMYLTPRESECLLYLLKGYTVPQTAENLGLSKRTVEYYMKRIKEKLGCRSKNELLERLREWGFDKKYEAHK